MNHYAHTLLNRLRMRQVSLLLNIQEHRTLRAASQVMGMTQPAATKMLHELEDALGTKIFDRTGRTLTLNVAGKTVLGFFQGMRGSLESLARELDAMQMGIHGTLSVGSIMAASPAILTDALIAMRRSYPMLSINISTATSDVLIEALNQGDLDLVIGRIVSVKHEDYVFRPIANETLSVVGAVNHPLAGKPKVTLEALHRYPWILQGAGSPMRAVIEREFHDQHLVLPATLIETSSILTTADIVTRTEMIAVIPESVAAIFADSGRIKVLGYRIKNKLDPYGSLIKRDRPASPATKAFLTMLHPPELNL